MTGRFMPRSTRAPGSGFFSLLCALVLVLLAPRAEAGPPRRPVYTIAVGNNAVAEVLRPSARGLATLRYADDDALRFYNLMQHASRRAFLLTIADAETQRRFPEAARSALAPSLAELERVVEHVARAISHDRSIGDEPEFVFFFSGHGVRGESGGAALSLLDGGLTRAWLYERLLGRVPARVIHVIIDACHAEAVVRPRDADAAVEPLDLVERESYLDTDTLKRFPNVGAVLASSSSTQSFEWDAFRSGVFAHQLLSGLRGAADVNGDGRVEYSEVAAFLSAANLRVKDPRARLDIVVRPPPVDRRTALIDLSTVSGQFELGGRAEGGWAKGFFVESERGERLLDVFPEQRTALALRLPVGERLFVVRPDGETDLGIRAGGRVELGSLRVGPARTRPRGSVDSSLRDGLFRVRYGPAFYQGYVSQQIEFLPVQFFPEAQQEVDAPRAERASSSRKTLATVLLAAGGAAAVAAGVFTVAALESKHDYDQTDLERPATEAKQRYERNGTLAWVSGAAALGLAGAGLTVFLWPGGRSPSRSGPVSGFRLGVTGAF
jgi:hypothetical protein